MNGARGFSLVECIVASVLCATGLLAVVGSTRSMLDLALLGHRTAGAAEIAATRFATLHGTVCAGGSGSGTAQSGAFAEQWSFAAAGVLRLSVDDVTFTIGRRVHTAHFEATVACRS